MWRALVNPAGGLVYHVRAAIYGRLFWKKFKQELAAWLQQWQPTEQKLIIVGQSGGYMLDAQFLAQFKEIIAIDPDPLAAWIFKRRFGQLDSVMQTRSEDFFIEPGCDTTAFRSFLDSHTDAAVLFSNVLGQLPFLISDDTQRDSMMRFWHDRLNKMLEGRSWASFHDRYSSTRKPRRSSLLQVDRQLRDEELIWHFYGRDASGTWYDHQTQQFFEKNTHYTYFLWQITPRAFHIIEGVAEKGSR